MKSNLLNLVGLPQSGIFQVARTLNRHPQVKLLGSDVESSDMANRSAQVTSEEVLHVRTVAADGFSDISVIVSLMEQDHDAMCIAVLRSPIDVVYEIHAELWRLGWESESDFDAAWGLQSERSQGRSIPQQCADPNRLQFAQYVDCIPSLSRLWDLTSHDQRCVVLWDEFTSQPKQQTSALWEFTGLEQPPYWDERLSSFSFETMATAAGSKVRARTRDRLCDEFLEHVAHLAAVMGRDLQHWLRRSNEIIDEDLKTIRFEPS